MNNRRKSQIISVDIP